MFYLKIKEEDKEEDGEKELFILNSMHYMAT